MTSMDRRLRAAERAAQDGDLQAAEEFIRLGLRAGRVAPPVVELAAWTGYVPAQQALGYVPELQERLSDSVARLVRFGREIAGVDVVGRSGLATYVERVMIEQNGFVNDYEEAEVDTFAVASILDYEETGKRPPLSRARGPLGEIEDFLEGLADEGDAYHGLKGDDSMGVVREVLIAAGDLLRLTHRHRTPGYHLLGILQAARDLHEYDEWSSWWIWQPVAEHLVSKVIYNVDPLTQRYYRTAPWIKAGLPEEVE